MLDDEVYVVYFHSPPAGEVYNMKIFKDEEKAIQYGLELAAKEFGREFKTLTEMEIWTGDPVAAPDIHGFVEIKNLKIN